MFQAGAIVVWGQSSIWFSPGEQAAGDWLALVGQGRTVGSLMCCPYRLVRCDCVSSYGVDLTADLQTVMSLLFARLCLSPCQTGR